MLNINASLWLRLKFEFSADEIGTFDALSLRMKYLDGFVAYLNGVEVARRNYSGIPQWNSHADSDRSNDSPENFVNIDISSFLNRLTRGTNVLAVQAFNNSVSDPNFLIQPELSAAASVGVRQYFSQATPGKFNGSGAVEIVSDTNFSVNRGFYDAPFPGRDHDRHRRCRDPLHLGWQCSHGDCGYPLYRADSDHPHDLPSGDGVQARLAFHQCGHADLHLPGSSDSPAGRPCGFSRFLGQPRRQTTPWTSGS